MVTIALLTFKEALRKKILIAAVILTLLFLALYATGLHYAALDIARHKQSVQSGGGSAMDGNMFADTAARMMLVLGLYVSSSIVSLLAVFSSVGSVSSEIENGMLHAVLAKPVRRRSVILGKFTGYALMLSCYAALLFISVLALNYFITGIAMPPGLPRLVGLFVLQSLVLLTVSLAGSTRLSTLANGIVAFMLYTVGVIGGMVEWIGAAALNNSTLVTTGIVASLLMPADSLYRMIAKSIAMASNNPMDTFIFGPFGAATEPSAVMVVYIFLYILALLLVAVRTFSKRDIG